MLPKTASSGIAASLRRTLQFEEAWARFCALGRTLGPSANAVEDWRRGRERYALWALRVTDPVVLARMTTVAEVLGAAVVPVKVRDAHVTAWVCGFPTTSPSPENDDDVAEATIAAQRAAVAQVPGVRLLVGAPNAFATCAFLEVHDPHGDLAALRGALAVPGAKEVRFAPYQPHVTVGRFDDSRPVGPIAAALGALRASARLPIHAVECAVELIELDARAPDRLTIVWPRRGAEPHRARPASRAETI
jgi:hypothetical protein